ncbi:MULTISPECIES: hypothetical protein [Streptomyces]|uniref:Uncharacterized protein n=1 Tax=Streptomyces canarius TaxID=285453 RepID=A0ABQ3DA03_9ACTN|nr:hypothetical protein [Streptomyces canarius]GHA60548.1 hypothetical protein GCM10010345_75990 [Streptomyces canarius]
MTAERGGLPYEECKRRQRENPAPRDRTMTPPANALPPFHPAFHPGVRGAPGATGPAPAPGSPPRPRRRPGRRVPDGAAVSGFLAAPCVGAPLAAIGLAAVRRC